MSEISDDELDEDGCRCPNCGDPECGTCRVCGETECECTCEEADHY